MWQVLVRVLSVAAVALAGSGCRTDPIGPSPVKPADRAVQAPPQLIPPIQGGSDFTRQQVIRFFAPVIYQDIEDHSEADLFSRVTFDGDWNGANWANTFRYPKRAYVYTSLIRRQPLLPPLRPSWPRTGAASPARRRGFP
jgi:hypothetical protein